jgi:hypothetical protein
MSDYAHKRRRYYRIIPVRSQRNLNKALVESESVGGVGSVAEPQCVRRDSSIFNHTRTAPQI